MRRQQRHQPPGCEIAGEVQALERIQQHDRGGAAEGGQSQALRLGASVRGDARGGRRVDGEVPRRRPQALPLDADVSGRAALQTPQHHELHQHRSRQDRDHLRGGQRANGVRERGHDPAELLHLAKKDEQVQRQASGLLGHGDTFHQTGKTRLHLK